MISSKEQFKKKQKQITIDEHLNAMKDDERSELIKKLLEIKGRKKNG